MAATSQDSPAGKIAQALIDFSLKGAFPEEQVSSLSIDSEVLPAAIEDLANAKSKLQVLYHLFRRGRIAVLKLPFLGRDTHNQRRDRRRRQILEIECAIRPG